jgi:hypothetical protein
LHSCPKATEKDILPKGTRPLRTDLIDENFELAAPTPNQIRRFLPTTKPGMLPITWEGTIASGVDATIFQSPLVYMRLERLIVPNSYASCFILKNLMIGRDCKFGAIGEVLCEVFWGDDERPDIPPIMMAHTVAPGQVVALTVRNISLGAMPFNCVFQTLEVH